MLSIKDLVFKEERLVKKLVDWYIGLYIIKEVVSTNTVKLRLPTLIRVYPVVSFSKILKIDKILNKRKIRGVVKYLVQYEVFIAEYDT